MSLVSRDIDWLSGRPYEGEKVTSLATAYSCACDMSVRFDGAYGEGEEWGDFLGPDSEQSQRVQGGIRNRGDAYDTFDVRQFEMDRLMAMKIDAEWSGYKSQ